MNIRRRFIILFLSFAFCEVFVSQNNLFLKNFASSPIYTVFSFSDAGIDTLSSNSFITGGFQVRWSNGNGDSLTKNSFLQKTEVSGLTKWYRNYHLNGYDLTFQDLKVMPNKDILVGGQTSNYFSNNQNSSHGTLLRTDSNGYVKWFRLYPKQKIYKLLLLKNGNIGVLASDSGIYYGKYLKLSLLSQTGNLIWSRKFLPADTNGYYGTDLVEGKNKSILIVGYTTYPPIKSFLILTDSVGNKINDVSLSTPINSSTRAFYKAVNYFDKGFYAVGVGKGTNSNITGSIIKLDNSLNIIWYKLLQTQSGNSEFMDINTVNNNNLIILCEPENYGTFSDMPRAGLTFIDSNGVSRKNFLFTTDTITINPLDFLLLKNGNVLFSARNPWTRYFGITDTSANGFCTYTQINYPNINNSEVFNYNTFNAINSTFNYSLSSLYLFQPIDLDINYYCSSGPTGPLDPTNPTNNIIKNEKNEYKIFVYPNPSNDFILITTTSNENKFYFFKSKIKLINSNGEMIINYTNTTIEPFIKMDLKKMSAGIYYLFIEVENGENYSKKIILK